MGQCFIYFQVEDTQRVLSEWETVVMLPNALYCPFTEKLLGFFSILN